METYTTKSLDNFKYMKITFYYLDKYDSYINMFVNGHFDNLHENRVLPFS